jgi:hypothetical protein
MTSRSLTSVRAALCVIALFVGTGAQQAVASGKRSGQTLVVLFPYAEGAFRNTYAFDPKSHDWSLVIESQAAGGAWSNFATYTLVHSKT